jgi:excisionase family DNA binding protein
MTEFLHSWFQKHTRSHTKESTVKMKENLLTVQAVAEHLRLNPMTVYKWVKRGRIPAIRLGYSLRFRPSDIQELEDRGYASLLRSGRESAAK